MTKLRYFSVEEAETASADMCDVAHVADEMNTFHALFSGRDAVT